MQQTLKDTSSGSLNHSKNTHSESQMAYSNQQVYPILKKMNSLKPLDKKRAKITFDLGGLEEKVVKTKGSSTPFNHIQEIVRVSSERYTEPLDNEEP